MFGQITIAVTRVYCSVNIAKKGLDVFRIKHPINPDIKITYVRTHDFNFGSLGQRTKPALKKLDKANGFAFCKTPPFASGFTSGLAFC